MAFIEVIGLGYSLPGKRLLFSDVEFKVASGQRAALIGGNGVGKSTLLRIVAGEDDDYVGTARVEGTLLYMRQFVATPHTTVRELLRSLLTASMRSAGDELMAAELAAEHDESEAAGLRSAEAVARWQELGGYAEEAAWNAACGIVLGQPYDAGDRPPDRAAVRW
jgi:ATPase subunit of ABC transporter with duplicated ATPase domains